MPPAEQIAASKGHVRQMLHVLQDDAQKANAIIDESKLDEEAKDAREALKQALGDDFWKHFDDDPYGSLELLEKHAERFASE